MFVIGIGPGNPQDRTHRAERAVSCCSTIVGYAPYVESIADLCEGKDTYTSGMMQEADRCRMALQKAVAGATVALVSSGDAGVYGMAGLAMEMAAAENLSVEIEVVAGVSAANAAAAQLGAPLMLDSATISLSDLLVPWETIITRLQAVAAADMVVSLYNPRSKKRVRQLEEAAAIFRHYRPGTTPVGIVTAAGDKNQQVVYSDLEHFLDEEIGMRSLVIIGNSTTRLIDGRMVTPRGYYR
ncbi:precorrin-3 methyltransferase [Desulfuromusa kysingii]|uniref:Precorrin-3 methyltransferase n=1 Tax=Desulfuromusa kysingii TaxID=37625 RepID=A0A1H4AI75_9BACT|nr:precorrin-3B C(17)-methyltransferase [Desulfuromusa kysingii]SEA35441.1 precorrin-3 methyltransferase [Desulfuromusa kysingii]